MVEYEKLVEAMIGTDDIVALRDAVELCKECEKEGAVTVMSGRESEVVHDPRYFDLAHSLARKVRVRLNRMVRDAKVGEAALDLYYQCHLFDAPYA